MVIVWILRTRSLGIYTIVITIAALVKMFSPLGTELGTVYFVPDIERMQIEPNSKVDRFINGFIYASSIMCMAMLWLPPAITDRVSELRVIATALLFWTPLHTIVGLLK